MKYKTLKLLKRRKRIRQQMEKTNRWIRYITIFLFCCLFLVINGCDNSRQSIGISTKPLLSGEKLDNSTKLNWKITWGKIRAKEDDD